MKKATKKSEKQQKVVELLNNLEQTPRQLKDIDADYYKQCAVFGDMIIKLFLLNNENKEQLISLFTNILNLRTEAMTAGAIKHKKADE